MNRTTVALLAALEALIAVAVGLGIVLVPLTILWAVQFDLGIDWAVFFKAAADVWLLGHGVDLTITLPATTAAALGLPGASVPFPMTIALLGFALLALLFGVRTGLRAAQTPYWRIGIVSAVVVYGLLGTVIALSARSALVAFPLWQGVLLPTFVFALGVAVGVCAGIARHARGDTDAAARGIRARFAALAPATRDGILAALRGGTAATALLLAAAAVLTALLVVVNFGTIIGLYEGLHAGALGGSVLTLGELALLPNLVVWAASWLIGPGFALGTGSSVGPMGTQLGPIPSLPLFGVLPQGELLFGFIGLVVPLICGYLAGVLVRSRVAAVPGSARTAGWSAATALGIGAVAGIQLGLLAWWSAGAFGPGRLHEVGPNPWLVGVLAAIEVAVAAAIGLLSRARR
ncbi:cell division protein PerM [Leifsonia sp. Root112D2]|uniref:cell division protein PerM n=1 Tax=Leifsonia sp. Root112D2 TaxID=1736426 RepID=UPI0006FCC82F|nr:DUF6350 family protein [Leifsonia sp. Root112D2]KQV07257.1 hypothetical protein ASC63_08080 [Leifsonia sp. Root112D2]